MSNRITAALWVVVATMLLGGCGGGGSGGGGSGDGAPAPVISIQASTATIAQGGNVTLTWSAANATGCTAGSAWFGNKATAGSETVGPVVTNSTYTLRCTGAGGTATGSATVSVSYGAGQLPFRRVVLADGAAPWAKGFGDVDGDGAKDVIVAGGHVLGSKILWYRQGDWQSFLISAVGGGDSLVVADINRDGALDVVSSNGLAWYENPRGSGGDPTQPWVQHTIDATMTAHDLAVADIDGDARLDVVARPEGSGAIVVYMQNASGGFNSVAIPTATAPGGLGLALGDIDRDGKLDIVPGGYWLRAPANPLTDAWTRYEIGTWPNGAAVQIADINGDGRVDVMLSPSLAGPGFLSWFTAPTNPLTGTWSRNDVLAVENVHAFQVIDVNHDGKLDVVFAEMHTAPLHRIGIYYNQGAGASWTEQLISRDGSHNIAVADINGDGAYDIVGANSETSASDGGALNVWFGVP